MKLNQWLELEDVRDSPSALSRTLFKLDTSL